MIAPPPALVVLLIILALCCLLALWFALMMVEYADRARRAAREARTRAALAESALFDIRHRRSQAVAQGNRTRGQAQAELRAAKLAEMEDAIALRNAGWQRSLPLESGVPDGAAPAEDAA